VIKVHQTKPLRAEMVQRTTASSSFIDLHR
jgi:hypothetical protein